MNIPATNPGSRPLISVRDPLLLPLGALLLGLALAAQPVTAAWPSFALISPFTAAMLGLLLVLLALGFSRQRAAYIGFCGTLLLLGIHRADTTRPHKPAHTFPDPRTNVMLQGCIAEEPLVRGAEESREYILALNNGGRIRLAEYPHKGQFQTRLQYGQQVQALARVRNVRNFGNNGGFDAEGYYSRRNIWWQATLRHETPLQVTGDCGHPWKRRILDIRQHLLQRISNVYANNHYASEMMQALLLGDISGMQEDWTEGYRLTGTYHALVISGLHVATIAGLIFELLRFFRLSVYRAGLIASLLAWSYALTAGLTPPVLRASAAFVFFMVARSLFRKARILNVLAGTAIGALLLDPQQIYEASFQLSFLSVGALGLLFSPFSEWKLTPWSDAIRNLASSSRDLRLPAHVVAMRIELRLIARTIASWRIMPERAVLFILALILRVAFYLREAVLLSLVAFIALGLPMVLMFHRINFAGLSANVPVVFLFSLAIPLGFAALLPGCNFLAPLNILLLDLARRCVDWHVSLDPGLRVPDPPTALALALFAALLFTGWQLTRRSWLTWPAALASTICFAAMVFFPFRPALAPGTLELTMQDVGQGESLFIALPTGETMLIDTGGLGFAGAKRGIDTGEDIVSPSLWSRQLRRLDILALTHIDHDHAGGAPAIIRNFQPRELWVPHWASGQKWERLAALCQQHGTRIRRLAAGDSPQVGAQRFEVLWPPRGEDPGRSQNAWSLVLRMEHGQHRFLLTGDINSAVEERMLATNILTPVSVLKVAHHGSRFSTSQAWLDRLQPRVALISAGYANTFQHPHPAVLDRLSVPGTSTWSTDRHAAITVRSNGQHLHVSHLRDDSP
jgi:competence protein ComEC